MFFNNTFQNSTGNKLTFGFFIFACFNFALSENLHSGWTIAKNSPDINNNDPQLSTFDQKWGQAAVVTPKSTNSNPRLLDWEDWQKMKNGTTAVRTMGGPMLIVASGEEQKMEPEKAVVVNKKLPAEAEEDETSENPESIEETTLQTQKWHQGWAHMEKTLIAAPLPLNLTHVPVSSDGMDFTELTVMSNSNSTDCLSNETTKSPLETSTSSFMDSSLPIPTPSPFGQQVKIAPEQALDLRQLPSLMHLLKQIPTVIRSFQENPSTSSGSTSERIGNGALQAENGFLPSLPNGLLQQFLGQSSNTGDLSRIQSRAVSGDYGGAKPVQFGTKQAADEEEDEEEENSSENSENPPTSPPSLPFLPKLSLPSLPTLPPFEVPKPQQPAPIIPVMTTHGLLGAQQFVNLGQKIAIRRLPSVELSKLDETPKMVPTISQNAGKIEKLAKIGVKERQERLNIYGITTIAAAEAYEAPLSSIKPENNSIHKTRPRPQFNIEKLTVNELGQLERIHKKLFKNSKKDDNNDAPQIVEESVSKMKEEKIPKAANKLNFNQNNEFIAPLTLIGQPQKYGENNEPRIALKQIHSSKAPVTSLSSTLVQPAKLRELVIKGIELGQLDQSMLNDLLAVGELPDLEELTSGMDLALLHKPGGFAILKQQFIERLIQRALKGGGMVRSRRELR